MARQIADRLREARQQRMVGRVAELTLFREAVLAETPPFFVLNLYGPGGVGKSTLLQALRDLCHELEIPCFGFSAEETEPTPDGVRAALGEETLHTLAESSVRQVLWIDHFEVLEPLEVWFRDRFLPSLSGETLVVIAGRNPVSAAWRGDMSWQALLKIYPLRNLSPDDCRTFLTARQIPSEYHKSVLAFTHGYPLALSLVGDVFAQRGLLPMSDALPSLDIVATLLERFVEKTPSALHRSALEVCALVRVTTEPVLAAMLGIPESHELFEWLRQLSFMEAMQPGIVPHPVAREALLADLRWRSPDRYADYHKRARAYYTERLGQSEPREQQRVLWDYVFLHRDNAVVRSAFTWQDERGTIADLARPSDGPALHALVERHEGTAAAALFDYWFAQPTKQVTYVFRNSVSETPVGLVMQLALDQTDASDHATDTAVRLAWDVVQQQAPLRAGEIATHFRFWMAADTYQEVSPIQSMIVVNCIRHYLTAPHLVFSFFPCALPELYQPVFAYAEMAACPEADYWMGEKHLRAFVYNWRKLPPFAWLALLADKEMALAAPTAVPPVARPAPLVALSYEAFEEAVRDAFKRFDQPEQLIRNPLLRSRVVVERAGGASSPPTARVGTIRSVLRELIERLQESPKRQRAYRALDRTFLRPAATQEKAAEVLDLPFSTYRRHLAEGITAVTEMLWHLELETGLVPSPLV